MAAVMETASVQIESISGKVAPFIHSQFYCCTFANMPTVFEAFGYRFFFYSNENDEPMHIHVDKGGAKAKYWILPEIAEEYSYGFKVRERREIKKLVIDNAGKIIEHWNRFFA